MIRIRLCILAGAAVPLVSGGVLFESTGDPSFNTNAPTGSLEDSGWQFQGKFRDSVNHKYLGTPVAPQHFITAQHVSGIAVGEVFSWNGEEYTTVAKIDDPGSDLTLWEVDGTFPAYAPLYTGSDETGKDLVVFGRGTQRGAPVIANGDTKGWEWGIRDFVLRWGENTVSGTEDYASAGDERLLRAEFNPAEGPNECMLSDKDSGGGLFIEEGGVWKLAGINYSVSPALFSTSASGSPSFNAALFDYSFKVSDSEKIYYYTGSSWTYFSGSADKPCSFYATRISSRYTWITNNIPDFDRDVDGLPDWWEMKHSGNPTSMVATADPDFDAFTNYEEWIADTVPTNGSSFLDMGPYSNAVHLAFTSSTNREYQIQYRENLADTNEQWMAETDWFPGSEPETVQPVSVSGQHRYYRVRVRL